MNSNDSKATPEELVALHTRSLATWAAGLNIEDMPTKVLRKAALVLTDDIAVIAGARNEPEVAKFHERMLAVPSGRPEATVFRGGWQRTDRLTAAVCNATAADWLELDEGYRKISCHAGLYVLPALLAEAEASELSVEELLRATVVAYEVVTRVARAFIPVDDGIHSHANYSPVGACAAIASARRLDSRQFLDALSTAFTLSIAGPRNHMLKGALVRNAWPAMGAWAGMMSVEWSDCGITGVPESAYDGLCVALHATPYPERLSDNLGTEWAVLDGYTKIYACCQHAHSAAEAALEILDKSRSNNLPGSIRNIVVEAHPLAMKLKEQFPRTSLAAKFSLPHVLAAAIIRGDVGAESFFQSTLKDEAIASLRTKVNVVPYEKILPPPNDRPARVTINLHDGTSLTAECLSATGGPDRPFGEDILMDKVSSLAGEVYPLFLSGMRKVIELDPAMMKRRWKDVVADFA